MLKIVGLDAFRAGPTFFAVFFFFFFFLRTLIG